MHVFALAGNQNSGKTTLFNRLTGSNQHVGNFPGVTVEKKEGAIKGLSDCSLVDLPGIYSLSPYTSEEIVTRDFLLKNKPCGIINIVDATNIERNLYLSLQLMELNIPMVIALNMMDEVVASGNSIDYRMLSAYLGIPVIPISAALNQNIDDLLKEVLKMANGANKVPKLDFCKGPTHKAIHAICHIIADKADSKDIPIRFAATKIVEGDDILEEALALNEKERHIISHIVEEMESELDTDHEAALADMRYNFIDEICSKCVVRVSQTREQLRSEKVDRILTHRIFGIPIFIGIMLLTFYISFTLLGEPLQGVMEEIIGYISGGLINVLVELNVSPWLLSLIEDGILAGIGSVLSFLPIIMILFLFLSILEDSGYMARVAFVMDKFLRGIGLSGRSFVPMLIGFGCSVPAIMATRTLASDRDRKLTITITPFMSCSAKLPIYGMIIASFFKEYGALVMIMIYCIGILVAVVCAYYLKDTTYKGEPTPFVMELPAYRIPSTRSVILHMWEKGRDFVKKAFTVIFLCSMIIWFLQSFDFTFTMVEDSSCSILASIGSFIAPIFKPLGFNDWRAATAILTGVTAKENVVGTLSVLTQATSDLELSFALQQIFTPLSSFSFLVFTVLYMPCIAAFAAIKREMGSWKAAIKTVGFQTTVAYFTAMIIYQFGSIFIG